MKISDGLKIASQYLESPKLARLILCEFLACSFEELFLNSNNELKNEDKFLEIVKKFKNKEPLEYIFGRAKFMDLEFKVGKGVLIPREETEILINKALEIASNIKNPKICEIGTGSGIISIVLAKKLKNAQILALDISQDALNFAKQNAKTHEVEIQFELSDLLEKTKENFDIIISNPPYIALDYPLDKMVLNEPSLALFGGQKGDEILLKLISQSIGRCKYLLCEMGYDQKNSLSKALKNANYKAKFYKDLAGFDRGFSAIYKG